MPTTIHPHTPIERLGAAIADEGVARHEVAVAALARAALGAGVDRVLCSVLADRSAPAVVRERAFAKVTLALAAAATAAAATARPSVPVSVPPLAA